MTVFRPTFFVAMTLSAAMLHAQRTPVMEYASLLNSVDITPKGFLELDGDNEILTTVFLPRGVAVNAILTKKGSTQPIHVQDFYINHKSEVFAAIDTRGKYRSFQFKEAGDYVISFVAGNQLMTQLPFSVYTRKNDDEFDPRTAWYTSGPWSDLAYMFTRLDKGADATVEFRMWAKRVSFDGATVTDIYDVDLKKDGDVVAIGRTGYVGTQKWLALRFTMRHPESKGGRNFLLKNLTARDGNYTFVVNKNKKLHAVYNLVVENGKPVLHPREASSYKPRSEYIAPRYAALADGSRQTGNTVWMSRVDDTAAKRIANAGPAEAAGPTAEQKKRWNWIPTSIDPNRPFQVTITDVETRSDTHIAAGEDIIAYGTGFPTGVSYLKVGENKPREIPNGEVYSSKLFHVCGKKIVLVRKNNVYVYDTETDTTFPIPASDITLYNPVGGLHNGNLLNANGYLVAAVNRATSVNDGNIVKIIDVSGDTPVVFPIKNANYNDRQVSSVALDAKNGFVAISSAEKKLIAVAKVAPLANQKVFDMTDYRGVDRRQIFIEDSWITYADRDLKVRLLKAGNGIPKAITEEAVGSSSNGLIVRKGRLVIPTQEHYGTRYHMAVSDLPDRPTTIPGTATPIKGTSGGLGMAGCAAIAIDKTVFIAGTPSGGVGVGEHLQMLDEENGKWIPVRNQEGEVISAIDVTTSMGLLAFKSGGRSRNTTIGYATYGQRIEIPAATVAKPKTTNPTKSVEIPLADDNPYNTHDERLASLLDAYLESEKQVGEAYIQAFGKEQGMKRTVDGIVDAMKAAGNDSLINDYLRMSAYVADKDRPQSETEQQNGSIDTAAVMSALNGEWKAIRFSVKGNDLPDEAIEKLRLTFANGKYVMTMAGGLQVGSYDINTHSSPMSMNININSGSEKGQKRMGSFKLLKDNRLLIVFATNETDRPSRFIPDESGNTILAVYSRTN